MLGYEWNLGLRHDLARKCGDVIFAQPRVHLIAHLVSHLVLRTHPQPLHSDANEPCEGEVDEGARGTRRPGPPIHQTEMVRHVKILKYKILFFIISYLIM